MQFTAYESFLAIVGDGEGDLGRPQPEAQGGEYESGTAMLGSERWRVRTARVTPKKPGAFVAVWMRDESGDTRPFDTEDTVSGLLVFVREGERFGVFRFTSAQLDALGVTRSDRHPGKRGFRVYPSWSENLNRRAAQTQAAQASAFTLLSERTQPAGAALSP